jgi:hypothetical protein
MMMNWKRFGRKRLWPNFKVIFRHSLEELRKITKPSIRRAGRRGRDLNPGTPEYKAGYFILNV